MPINISDIGNMFRVTIRSNLTVFCLLCMPLGALAGEYWIESGDEAARHHIQLLADSGVIDQSVSSWPIAWQDLTRALANAESAQLAGAQQRSFLYLKAREKQASAAVNAKFRAQYRSSVPGLTAFASDSREKSLAAASMGYSANTWAGRLSAAVIADPTDDQTYRFDGSYLVGELGNWSFGAGAIDRWWGPGWQSSLILSHNARPAPGLFVQRTQAVPLDLPVLRWIGPWSLQAFLNQLESDRYVPEAKLFGMRASFQPVRSLEIGFSRTAQWGGESRPEDWDTFWNMFTGRDNRGSGGIDADAANEPGNQLAGIDARFSAVLGGIPVAVYGQLIGEDEAGGLPSRLIGMGGVEFAVGYGDVSNRFMLESSNTAARFSEDRLPNYTYEHALYSSGYRYHGRSMGGSTDNDSEMVVLKGLHFFPNYHTLQWSIGRARLNFDGTNRSGSTGGHSFAEGKKSFWYSDIKYAFPLSKTSHVSIGAQLYNGSLQFRDERIESGLFARYELVFGEGI